MTQKQPKPKDDPVIIDLESAKAKRNKPNGDQLLPVTAYNISNRGLLNMAFDTCALAIATDSATKATVLCPDATHIRLEFWPNDWADPRKPVVYKSFLQGYSMQQRYGIESSVRRIVSEDRSVLNSGIAEVLLDCLAAAYPNNTEAERSTAAHRSITTGAILAEMLDRRAMPELHRMVDSASPETPVVIYGEAILAGIGADNICAMATTANMLEYVPHQAEREKLLRKFTKAMQAVNATPFSYQTG